ncbi:hypothetical protein BO99DRAFT_93840 [Aspergillus violaceofuscus CBS 115571]|uniref:Secreted protein n=1 Tax=Aspergillus violaceofuscus (strain CBS 115571) TaxID=1450538 RepID=A0A2V5IWE9_ASPV1|nr:hypothetical protein BO99DRAFT_93840 [Aspergillus violaceofuscus CBS 115571]
MMSVLLFSACWLTGGGGLLISSGESCDKVGGGWRNAHAEREANAEMCKREKRWMRKGREEEEGGGGNAPGIRGETRDQS